MARNKTNTTGSIEFPRVLPQLKDLDKLNLDNAIKRLLREEAKLFIYRNKVIEVKDETICCHKCLNAHLVKTWNDMGLDGEGAIKHLKLCEKDIGHEGYYLDEEKLISLS